MQRRKARELAVQALYQAALTGIQPERALQQRLEDQAYPAQVAEFAGTLVRGVNVHLKDVDDRISALSREWRLERLAKVDLAILRLAVFELLYAPDIPASVSINEAVELAKTFSTGESGRFINGILGRVAQDAAFSSNDEAKGPVQER